MNSKWIEDLKEKDKMIKLLKYNQRVEKTWKIYFEGNVLSPVMTLKGRSPWRRWGGRVLFQAEGIATAKAQGHISAGTLRDW